MTSQEMRQQRFEPAKPAAVDVERTMKASLRVGHKRKGLPRDVHQLIVLAPGELGIRCHDIIATAVRARY